MDFSFIVIGKNESNNLNRCFSSIVDFGKVNNLVFEIVYVDSQSTDNSLEIARSWKEVKPIVLGGTCNAAKARNLGASNAKGDYFIFADGDMIVYPEFGKRAILKKKLIYPFLNGHRIDVFYDIDGRCIGDSKSHFDGNLKDEYVIATGGLFAIQAQLWRDMGGMNSTLACFEDIDLAYRIFRKKKMKVLKIGAFFAEHHTINYTDKKRFFEMAHGNYFLFKGLIFRKNIFSKLFYPLLIKNHSFTILLLTIICLIITFNPYFLLLYLLAMFVKVSMIKVSPETMSRTGRFFIDMYIDIKTLYGFLFFIPSK